MRGGAVFWTVRRGATGSRRGVAVKATAVATTSEHISEHIVDDNVIVPCLAGFSDRAVAIAAARLRSSAAEARPA
jgi:hypothetical protein